jgi:hypothetical protein
MNGGYAHLQIIYDYIASQDNEVTNGISKRDVSWYLTQNSRLVPNKIKGWSVVS